MVYALAAAGSSCGDLVRCTLGDGVSLCPQRCAAMAQDAETPSTQQLRLRRVLAFLAPASMLGIEVLEVKFMGQERFYGACTGYPSVQDIVAGARAGQLRGRPAKRRLAALRLVAHHRRLEDAQNGDHTQLIRAHTPDARQRQPRTGSTPDLGRGQQQHATDATQRWRTTSTGPCASART